MTGTCALPDALALPSPVASHGRPPRASLVGLLHDAVAMAAHAAFLSDLRTGANYSYAQLWSAACGQAALLVRHGVMPGDRVALLTKNDPAFFPLLFACAMTGSVLVPINRDNLPADIEAVLQDSQPALVLRDSHARWDGGPSVAAAWATDPPPPPPPLLATSREDVLIIYTSGTTGSAKGVTLTHRNLTAMARRFVDVYTLRGGQRFLCMLPFYHINAPMITGLACIAAGAHVHLTDPYGFTNARAIFDMVRRHGINVLSVTPSIMASLLQLHPEGAGAEMPSLELCFCGTAPLGETLWRDFEALVGAPVYQGYGLTETTTWATMSPPDGRKRYDTVGLPVGCDVRIDGTPTGEVLIRGDIVMSGYHNKKKLTHKSIQEGWYRSGDIGYLDRDGQLVIVGRCKNIIKRAGVLVHPEQIDAALLRHPAVTQSCTVGMPDPLLGERVVSACVLNRDNAADLHAWAAASLSPAMRPDGIVPIGVIPRNPIGKVQAEKVREMLSGAVTDRVIHAFSRSKVSRAPSEQMAEIHEIVHQAVLAGTPITFTGFWGVGHRLGAAEPDRQAIERLAWIRDDIDAALGRKQAGITLLLADMHGRCNQIPDGAIDRYFSDIRALAEAAGLATRRSSEIWRDAGLDEADVARLAADPETSQAWYRFPLREDFLTQAEHRCGCPEDAEAFAYRYYCTCLTEQRAMTQALAGSIFFTYNAPKFRPVMPALPTVHWHSTKPGTTAKPWFT